MLYSACINNVSCSHSWLTCLGQVAACAYAPGASGPDGRLFKPLDAALHQALQFYRSEPVVRVRAGILADALLIIGDLERRFNIEMDGTGIAPVRL